MLEETISALELALPSTFQVAFFNTEVPISVAALQCRCCNVVCNVVLPAFNLGVALPTSSTYAVVIVQ